MTGLTNPSDSSQNARARLLGTALLAVWAGGCATFHIREDRCPSYAGGQTAGTPAADEVKIQYLGVGGYLIRHKDDTVLFGPVFTNPGLLEIALDHQIRTDTELVERLLPEEANQAKAIIVGHSHYDHLLDTPYIATRRATEANVYGSATTRALIQSVVPHSRIVDVSNAADKNESIPIGDSMRLWPIPSRHSDQARVKMPMFGVNLPVHTWRGEVLEDQPALPLTGSGWAEGRVFSFVLDFLNQDKSVAFRVYYQDSGTDNPVGIPRKGYGPQDGRRIDVSLICVGGDFAYLRAHPEAVIAATRPRFLILGHWEDFFVTQEEICRTRKVTAIPPPVGRLRKQPTKVFITRAERALESSGSMGKPILPCPSASVFYFPLDGSNDAQVHAKLRERKTRYPCPVPERRPRHAGSAPR